MQLSRVLNLPYNTAWFLPHRIHNAMAERDNRYLLKGIVELDDTYLRKAKKGGKRGRGTSKSNCYYQYHLGFCNPQVSFRFS